MQNQNFQQFNDTANQWRIKVKPKVSQKKKKKKKSLMNFLIPSIKNLQQINDIKDSW